MKKTVSLSALLLLTLCLGGRELFVSPSGSNTNPGTARAPFATIAFAASKARPGDTVKIGPGVYREQIKFTRSGKKEAPITFAGSRGKNGEFLTIVESDGIALDKWEKAPEVAPGVWKTKIAKRPSIVMMDGKMIAFINGQTIRVDGGKA